MWQSVCLFYILEGADVYTTGHSLFLNLNMFLLSLKLSTFIDIYSLYVFIPTHFLIESIRVYKEDYYNNKQYHVVPVTLSKGH